jgi:hypothetical protein
LLGAWFFAIAVSMANACVVHGLPGTTNDGMSISMSMSMSMSMSHGHAGEDGVPSDCARFCDDDTPLPAKVPSFDDASDGAGSIIPSSAPVMRVVARPDTRVDLNSVASRVVYPVLLQSRRLAL